MVSSIPIKYKYFKHNYMVSSNYSYFLVNCLHIRLQAFQSNFKQIYLVHETLGCTTTTTTTTGHVGPGSNGSKVGTQHSSELQY